MQIENQDQNPHQDHERPSRHLFADIGGQGRSEHAAQHHADDAGPVVEADGQEKGRRSGQGDKKFNQVDGADGIPGHAAPPQQ